MALYANKMLLLLLLLFFEGTRPIHSSSEILVLGFWIPTCDAHNTSAQNNNKTKLKY